MRTYLIPSLDTRRDALMDSIVSLHRQARMWRRIATIQIALFAGVGFVRHPAAFIFLVCLFLLICLMGGGLLFQMHWGNDEMQIANRQDTPSSHE